MSTYKPPTTHAVLPLLMCPVCRSWILRRGPPLGDDALPAICFGCGCELFIRCVRVEDVLAPVEMLVVLNPEDEVLH